MQGVREQAGQQPQQEERVISFDLETYPGLDPWHPDARIRMIVLSDEAGRAWVVQCTPDSRMPQWVLDILEDPTILKVGSNAKFDMRWCRRFGIEVENVECTSVREHVIDATNPKKDLKSLVFKYLSRLGDYSKPHRDLVRERGGWEHVEDDEQYDYCGGDGEGGIAAWRGQQAEIERLGLQLPRQLMLDLYPVLAEMEINGSVIDMAINAHLDDLYSQKLEALRAEIVKVLGPINLNSVPQLVKALKKAVPNIKLSKRSWERAMGDGEEEEATTARFVLEREAHKHEVIPMVLEFRKYRVRHSTFIKGVREKHAVYHHGQWFVHPTYRPDVTETYRLSSQAPNDQNAPRKDKDDPELSIKKQVVSRFNGGSIIEADQSQIEIRIAAWLSQDEKMLKAIASGEDIHYSMAAVMLEKKVPPAGEEETCDPAIYVTELERTECKHRTFLILYGGGAKKLAQDLKISKRVAQRLIDEYFEAFTGLRDFIDKSHCDVHSDLSVETVFGFRRRFIKPEQWDSPEGWTIQRQAFNTKVQSPAACVTYASMIYVHEQLKVRELRSILIKQVHDSMVFDVYPGEEHAIAMLAKDSMENAGELVKKYGVLDLDVPLHSDVEIGDNWAGVRKYEMAT